jgi:hypothetical protein
MESRRIRQSVSPRCLRGSGLPGDTFPKISCSVGVLLPWYILLSTSRWESWGQLAMTWPSRLTMFLRNPLLSTQYPDRTILRRPASRFNGKPVQEEVLLINSTSFNKGSEVRPVMIDLPVHFGSFQPMFQLFTLVSWAVDTHIERNSHDVLQILQRSYGRRQVLPHVLNGKLDFRSIF